MMKNTYLKHISGMKGMGALIVFIYHFLYCFYPLFIPEGMNAAPVEHIPVVNILVNGNFAVCLFILLSGYLMAGSVERLDSLDAYGTAIVRRYVRLMIPLAVAATLVIVGIGVLLIVRSSILWGAYQMLLEEGDYHRLAKEASRKAAPFNGIYWGLVTAAFLAWGFLGNAWDRCWVVWPVAGVAYGAVYGIVSALRKR